MPLKEHIRTKQERFSTSIWLSIAEKAYLNKLAQKYGTSRSGMIRALLRETAAKEALKRDTTQNSHRRRSETAGCVKRKKGQVV
ncbi:MAG: hypothetical protein ACYSSI_00200 [Planctomycetota bacterium]|jgi:hypothetical protein